MHCYWVLLAFMIVTFYSKVQSSTLEIVQLEKLVEKNMNLIRLDKSLKVLTAPTLEPTEAPSEEPSEEPTEEPSSLPSSVPSTMPSGRPTVKPSAVPTVKPSAVPTVKPSAVPSVKPSAFPSSRPTSRPFSIPTSQPTAQPFSKPTGRPSSQPSSQPTNSPTAPSFRPTVVPTVVVTQRSTEIVKVNTTYTFGSVNALQLNNVSIATITTVIVSLAPKPSRVFVRRIYRIIAGTGRRLQPVQLFNYGADATISFNLVDYPGQNTTQVANTQSSLIKQIATNGTFETVLRSLAVANNATQLFNVTVVGVNTTSEVTPTPTTNDQSSSSTRTARLTDGQIAGLVIGCVLGSSCLLAVLYYSVIAKRKNTRFSTPGTFRPYEPRDRLSQEIESGYFEDTITITVGDDAVKNNGEVVRTSGGIQVSL